VEALGLAVLAAAMGGLALWQGRRLAAEAPARAAARAGYFDACAPLFADTRRALAPDGFARLNGRRGGRLFDLQAVPDALSFRKLPALWVLVSLPEPMPVAATLDLMLRPTGAEPFSRFAGLPVALPPPPGLPPGAALRADSPAALPLAGHLAPLRDLLAAPPAKEVVIAPSGLRIVWLAEEAERAGYLLFRNAELGRTPFPAETLRRLTDALARLADDLQAPPP
jgi:hypothetical protein